MRGHVLLNSLRYIPKGHRIFYGVESWSGVMEWSIGVEWSQILEWQKSLITPADSFICHFLISGLFFI